MSEPRRPAKRITRPEPPPSTAPAAARLDHLLVVVAQWTAALAQALQIALGGDIYDFATRLGAGWRTVADWNTNPTIVPKWRMQHALNDALRRATDEQKIKFALLTQRDPLVWVANSVELRQNGAGTHRRDLTKTGLAAAFAPLAEAIERITAAAANPDTRVDARLVADHEDVADTLAALYRTERPDALVDQAILHADTLDRLLDHPMTGSDRRRLEAVAVAQCAQAAMLAFMSTDYPTARRYFALARSLAHDSGDAMLRAQALAVASILDSPIRTSGRRGDSRRAVELLNEAVHHDSGHAWMHSWLANELAFTRDERGFFGAVETAERLSGRSGHTDGRGFFAGLVSGVPAVVGAEIGVGLVLLGRADEGVDLLRPGLALPWPRVQVAMLGHTATAGVLQDEPEQCCADLHRALDLSADAGYSLGVERVLGVRDRFPDPWADLSCVHNLDQHLHR
ncbi:MAG: hypothetical protein ACRDYA_02580 [Egibacteraceae bacterium]